MTEHNEYYYDFDRNMDSTYPIKKVENKVKYKFSL